MNLADPEDYIDAVEDFVIEQMAEHGWRLESKPFSSWPIPDGWQYCSLPVGSVGGRVFKCEILTRWRATGPGPMQGDETMQDCKRLEAVLHALWTVREALDHGDATATLSAKSALENSLQFFEKRRKDRDLHIASKLPRPKAQKLPDVVALRAELDDIANGPAGKHGAVAIVARRYGVTPDGVRKALKK